MKKLLAFIVTILFFVAKGFSQNIGIGTPTPHVSAKLEINSTNSGILVPRMTTVQRTAISSPALSLLVFDTNTNSFWFFNGTAWINMGSSGATNYWSLNGTHIFNNNSGNVGIGTNTPNSKLQVVGGPIGVYGGGTNYGIVGETSNGHGVFGSSNTGRGVSGSSLYGYGVYGAGGPYGVYGTGTSYGVWGVSSYLGVFGDGTSTGVYGRSTSGNGVYGISSFLTGVYGASSNYHGGHFYSGNNIALWATTGAAAVPGVYAGVFEGNVYTYGIYASSDKSLKKNIQDVGDAMSIINQLKPKNYEFRNDGKYAAMNLPKGNHYGLIAQELEEILPDLVADAPHGLGATYPTLRVGKDSTEVDVVAKQNEATELPDSKAINYMELIPILIKGIQEQQKQIDALVKELQLIKGKLK